MLAANLDGECPVQRSAGSGTKNIQSQNCDVIKNHQPSMIFILPPSVCLALFLLIPVLLMVGDFLSQSKNLPQPLLTFLGWLR